MKSDADVIFDFWSKNAHIVYGFPQAVLELTMAIQHKVYHDSNFTPSFITVGDLTAKYDELYEYVLSQVSAADGESLVRSLINIAECVAWREIGGICIHDCYRYHNIDKAKNRLGEEQQTLIEMIWSRFHCWTYLKKV